MDAVSTNPVNARNGSCGLQYRATGSRCLEKIDCVAGLNTLLYKQKSPYHRQMRRESCCLGEST